MLSFWRHKASIFPLIVLIISLVGIIDIARKTPFTLNDVTAGSGEVLSVKCNKTKTSSSVHLLVKYKNEPEPVLEGVPQVVSDKCTMLLKYEGKAVTISKAKNYVVGLAFGNKTIVSVQEGLGDANSISGVIFYLGAAAFGALFVLLKLSLNRDYN